jgi:hypothetical protein
MTKNINLPMELINKILTYRPTHPTADIIKVIFNNFNRMQHDMFEKFHEHEISEFSWEKYKQGFPIYSMYFGTLVYENNMLNWKFQYMHV